MKLGDMTLKEIAEICDKCEDCKFCPFNAYDAVDGCKLIFSDLNKEKPAPRVKIRYGDLTIDQLSKLCNSQIDCPTCPVGWSCPRVVPVPASWHTDKVLTLPKKIIDKNSKDEDDAKDQD